MEEFDVTIREAQPEDAENILKMMHKVAKETEFLVMDDVGLSISVAFFKEQIRQLQESMNYLLLIALDKEQVIGAASIRSSDEKRLSHIGELGISILKEYWSLGLGSILMEELITWAQENDQLYRLELDVQSQNQRAVHLYKKFGFSVEAVKKRGARGDDGRFLDVLLMSKFIDHFEAD
ncbi:MAG TPA: GNAT family N-acetyltransferase [Candidatus Tetragenococcus pullicola]|nr:GNAT family N-acetyltransferase [Candidatus Tetragenococcus pullicola]